MYMSDMTDQFVRVCLVCAVMYVHVCLSVMSVWGLTIMHNTQTNKTIADTTKTVVDN